jgi:hypothetical protein
MPSLHFFAHRVSSCHIAEVVLSSVESSFLKMKHQDTGNIISILLGLATKKILQKNLLLVYDMV